MFAPLIDYQFPVKPGNLQLPFPAYRADQGAGPALQRLFERTLFLRGYGHHETAVGLRIEQGGIVRCRARDVAQIDRQPQAAAESNPGQGNSQPAHGRGVG